MLKDIQAQQPDFFALYNHDPKTVTMAPNAFMPFDEIAAAWKGELLRHHVSQQLRNIRSRGYGFDERLLLDNKNSAKELNGVYEYAVFEIQYS